MSSGDRQPGPSSSRVKEEYGFIMSTTVDDLSYTPSAEERSRDAAQFVATGRKSWKTLRGGGEAVWPPHLEAALLEALEKYHPETVGSKSDTILGRFPMRNRFISDYIFEATGKRRTPKQVGSRLQQLRDTCKKDKILQLLSHRNTRDTGSSSQSERSVSTSASPSPPPDHLRSVPTKQDQTYIKVLLQDELWPAPTPTIRLINMDSNYPQSIQLSPTCPPSGTMSQNRSSRNILPYLSGAVELASSCALLPQSTFVVYVEGSTSSVHSEVAPLKCHSSPMQRSGWLYGFDLVPTFWQNLCASRDVTRYTIVQTLKPMHSTSSNEVDGANRSISVVYKFKSGDSSLQRSANTQPLDFPLYPGSPHGQAISMASPNPPAPQGYPHWQPPVQPDNADAGWTQLAPRYPNRFDNSLASQPAASNHMVSFGVPYPSHRLPSMSKEATPSGLCSHADVGSYYINQGPPSHSYGPEQAPHSQHFGYS